MTYSQGLFALWAPLDSLQGACEARVLTEHQLGDFYFILQNIDDFCNAYYRYFKSLKKFIEPKDQQTIKHMVTFLESFKIWIKSIKQLDFENYERIMSTLPLSLIRELNTNLRGDTMLRAEKNVSWDYFDKKTREYQKLFKKAKECCI
jgi:hypothetical protein